MAVASAVRIRPRLGLWLDLWRATGTTTTPQWQQSRHASRTAVKSTMERENRKTARATPMMQREPSPEQYLGMLMPGTFVRPPLSRFPFNPRFIWEWIRIRCVDAGTRLGYRFSSKRGLFKPALYKPQTAKLVPTAKALHRAMYEALARGDKEGLHKVCGVELRNRFERAIDGRDPGRRFEWELVRYNKTLWGYPRIVDNKLNAIPIPDQRPNSRPPFLRQVVVAIASTQRRVQYDHSKAGGGRVVRGSEVEVDVVENVVMACTLDRDTYVATDWKIIALVDETTPEKWTQEMELVREFQLGDAAKKHRLVDRPQR